MNKLKFYNLSMQMKEDSSILFTNNSFHTSVYLAGYMLESYFKIFLIHHHNGLRNIDRKHLDNDNILLSRVTQLFSIYPEFFDNSILQIGDEKYPNFLLNGNGDSIQKSKWVVEGRYNIEYWSDRDFASKIQDEISYIEESLINLRLDGRLL
jgi:hypothetical protein